MARVQVYLNRVDTGTQRNARQRTAPLGTAYGD